MYKFTQQFVEYCESNLNLEDYKGYDYSSISVVQAFWNDDILHTEIGVLTEENPKQTKSLLSKEKEKRG